MPEQKPTITKPLTFEVYERGRWAYILWPWTAPLAFVYNGLIWEAKYQMRSPAKMTRYCWIEFVGSEGTHGEYRSSLFFGSTFWGPRVFRQFNARCSHALTQHGLDGLPKKLWDAAYEYDSGEPVGQVKINFRVSTKQGLFGMTFFDWMQHFASGQNGHISKMGISIAKT